MLQYFGLLRYLVGGLLSMNEGGAAELKALAIGELSVFFQLIRLNIVFVRQNLDNQKIPLFERVGSVQRIKRWCM